MTTEELKIETYGTHLIAQAAANVEKRVQYETHRNTAISEEIEKLTEITGQEPFLEWAALVDEICNTFNVSHNYPSEQREMATEDSDWRAGVRAGFWHILKGAIESQLDEPQSIDIPRRKLDPLTDSTGFTEDDDLIQLKPDQWKDKRDELGRTHEYTLKKTLTKQIPLPKLKIVTCLYESPVNDYSRSEYNFLQYAALMDTLTEKYLSEQWNAIDDTQMRESISSGDYCWSIVNTYLPELMGEIQIEA